jgi:hypothetical protein
MNKKVLIRAIEHHNNQFKQPYSLLQFKRMNTINFSNIQYIQNNIFHHLYDLFIYIWVIAFNISCQSVKIIIKQTNNIFK